MQKLDQILFSVCVAAVSLFSTTACLSKPPLPVDIPDPTQQALRDIHGDDQEGKDGPLAKAGFDLVLLYREFEACHIKNCATFVPSNPSLRLLGDSVLIDGVAYDDGAILKNDLVGLGMQSASHYGLIVSGYIPIKEIPALAGLSELRYARPSTPIHAPRQTPSTRD